MSAIYIASRTEFSFTNGLFAGSKVEQVYPALKAISHPLRILRDGGVVASRRVDNYSFYRIISPAILQIIGKS